MRRFEGHPGIPPERGRFAGHESRRVSHDEGSEATGPSSETCGKRMSDRRSWEDGHGVRLGLQDVTRGQRPDDGLRSYGWNGAGRLGFIRNSRQDLLGAADGWFLRGRCRSGGGRRRGGRRCCCGRVGRA